MRWIDFAQKGLIKKERIPLDWVFHVGGASLLLVLFLSLWAYGNVWYMAACGVSVFVILSAMFSLGLYGMNNGKWWAVKRIDFSVLREILPKRHDPLRKGDGSADKQWRKVFG